MGIEPEKNGTNGHKKNGIGEWLSAPELSQKYGYHTSFFSGRARAGVIRSRGKGKAMRYSSADAKAAAHSTNKGPFKKNKPVAEQLTIVAEPVILPAPVSSGSYRGGDMLKRVRYLVLGVEVGVHSKEEAFDRIAKLVEQ